MNLALRAHEGALSNETTRLYTDEYSFSNLALKFIICFSGARVRVVKESGLRSDGHMSSWVRTPSVAFFNLPSPDHPSGTISLKKPYCNEQSYFLMKG